MRLVLLFVLLISFLGVRAEGPESLDTMHVRLVRKTPRISMQNVKVKVKQMEKVFTSTPTGYVALTGLKPGKYLLVVEGDGFRIAEKQIEKKTAPRKDTIQIELYPHLLFEGSAGLAFSQQAYGAYWQGGGLNSLAVGSRVNMALLYKKRRFNWDSQLLMVYGVIRQGENTFIKNEDRLELDSKGGYRISPHFLATTLLNFRTHFHQIYKVEKDGAQGDLVGAFFSPAFINLGTGFDYQSKEAGLSIYYSPINSKITVVRDSSLRPLYLPESYSSQSTRYELGSYLKINFQKEIMKNVILNSRADFFASHLSSFGSIDVNWENALALKVNKYLTANILTHLIYDEDILFNIVDESGQNTGQKGPRTQFREALNVGFVTTF